MPKRKIYSHYFSTWRLFPFTTPIHLLNQKGCSIESDHPPLDPHPLTANTAVSSARDDPPPPLFWHQGVRRPLMVLPHAGVTRWPILTIRSEGGVGDYLWCNGTFWDFLYCFCCRRDSKGLKHFSFPKGLKSYLSSMQTRLRHKKYVSSLCISILSSIALANFFENKRMKLKTNPLTHWLIDYNSIGLTKLRNQFRTKYTIKEKIFILEVETNGKIQDSPCT